MVPFQQKSRAAILGHCWPSGKTRRQQRLGRQTNLPNPFQCCTAVFLWIAPSPDKLRRVNHAPESLLSTGKTNTLFTVHYSHSMASVLPSRHSSYTQFSASTRNACRRMTRCRVSSASGTKVGTTSKTFFKLRALSFCFCPKVRGGSPLEARWRRKRPF